MNRPDPARQVAMTGKSKPWNVCNDCLEPLAKALLANAHNFIPGPIDFHELIQKHEFNKGITHLKVLISVDFGKDLESRVKLLQARLSFLNAKAWQVLLAEWGPIDADSLEPRVYERAAWILSERWGEWFRQLDPDEDYKPCPEAAQVFHAEYLGWVLEIRDLIFHLFDISDAIKSRDGFHRNGEVPAEGLVPKQQRSKSGRPRVKNTTYENKIFQMWDGGKGHFPRQADLDQTLGLSPGTTQRIVARVRKRNERRRQKMDEMDEIISSDVEQEK